MLATASPETWSYFWIAAAPVLAVVAKWIDDKIDKRNQRREMGQLKQDLSHNTQVTQEVCKLANGEKRAKLKTIASDKRRIASLTNAPEDIAAADLAEKELALHEESQK